MKNIMYMMRFCGVLFTLSKKLPILSAAQIILASIQPMVSVILSACIIQRLIDRAEPQQVILTAVVLVIFNLIAGIISAYLKSRVLILGDTVKDDFCLRVGQKIMKLPYERLEDPALQDLKQQALMPVIQWGNFEFVLNEAVPQIAGSILTIITTAAIVARNNLFLLIPISIIAVFCMFISAKRQRVFNEIMTRMGLIERKMAYFGQLAVDFSAGKEIRLFGMDRVIMDKIKQYSCSELYEFTRVLNSTTRFNILETILTQLQVYIIYGVVAFDVIDRGLPIGSFLEVTGLFANVGASVYMLLNTLAAVNVRGHFIGKYFEFHTLPEANVAKTCVSSVNAAQDIEINNVSFMYAHTEKQILRDITLSIPAGKKIALVGENGSGKTTLVKLICGLLTPNGGVIQIGGRVINGCCNESVSAVFQDFKLFAFSIRENIEMSSPGQADAISSLGRVGLLEDIKKLDNGIETALYKVYDNNGVELSGGQGQKLAIARAIYKDTGVILLDEPTAALDPKAEAEIFINFQTITTGKTALLVSHRLTSCRFCDNIVVLADGQIIEQGTHDELMMITGGKYRQMFAAQAEYFSYGM